MDRHVDVPAIDQLVKRDPHVDWKSLQRWCLHLEWMVDREVELDVHAEDEMNRRVAMWTGPAKALWQTCGRMDSMDTWTLLCWTPWTLLCLML